MKKKLKLKVIYSFLFKSFNLHTNNYNKIKKKFFFYG